MNKIEGFSVILWFMLVASSISEGETKPFISRLSNVLRFRPTFVPTQSPTPKPPNKLHLHPPITSKPIFLLSKPTQRPRPKGHIGPPTAIPPPSPKKPSTANPLLRLTVHIPPAAVTYDKELNVKSGGEFTLITPMENFHYTSSGNVSLRCAEIQYQMQSSYSPIMTCFYLHFLTMKKKKYDEGTGGFCYMVLKE